MFKYFLFFIIKKMNRNLGDWITGAFCALAMLVGPGISANHSIGPDLRADEEEAFARRVPLPQVQEHARKMRSYANRIAADQNSLVGWIPWAIPAKRLFNCYEHPGFDYGIDDENDLKSSF